MTVVGVTSAGSGIGRSVVRSLAHSGSSFRVVGMDSSPFGTGIHSVDQAFLVPAVVDRDRYLDRLLEICAAERLDVLIPGLDLELAVLAQAIEAFKALGCTVIVSDPEVVRVTSDKLLTYEFCMERALPFVDTYSLADAREHADDLGYPVIVKPRSGSGSDDVRLVRDAVDLLAQPVNDGMIVQRYLESRGADLLSIDTAVGARLDQTNEVSDHYLLGAGGDVLGHFVSVNRLKNGVPVHVVPVTTGDWLDDGLPIVEALAALGARGPLNLQGRRGADGRVTYFELNARFTGITLMRTMMGFGEVEAAIDSLALGNDDHARRRLAADGTLVGFRHVGDAVVPSAHVESLIEHGRHAVGDPTVRLVDRVVVSGASGYVGANAIVQILRQSPTIRVEALVRSELGRDRLEEAVDNSRLTVRTADFADGIQLGQADAVVHLSAVREPFGDDRPGEMTAVNVDGTRKLVLAARVAGVARFIYLSSQAVYGTARPPLWSESLSPEPQTDYAISKWLGELMCSPEIAGDMQVVILRASRVYGFGHFMRWQELPHKFAAHAVSGESLAINGGSQRMDLIHVRDLAGALVSSLNVDLPRTHRAVLNIGGGSPVSLEELAMSYVRGADQLGLQPPRIEVKAAQGASPNFGMDIGAARTLLGWAPQTRLDDAVVELLSVALERSAAR